MLSLNVSVGVHRLFIGSANAQVSNSDDFFLFKILFCMCAIWSYLLYSINLCLFHTSITLYLHLHSKFYILAALRVLSLTPLMFDANVKFFAFRSLFFEVIPPAVYLRVTENVHHIVPFIERIIENGHAYATKEGAGSNI